MCRLYQIGFGSKRTRVARDGLEGDRERIMRSYSHRNDSCKQRGGSHFSLVLGLHFKLNSRGLLGAPEL